MAVGGKRRLPGTLALIRGSIPQGNAKHRSTKKVEVAPLNAVPPSPLWLPNVYAIAEWERLAPIMVEHKLLTPANESALAMMCAAFGKIIEGMRDPKRDFALSSTLLTQYRLMVSEFGLTPASQMRAVPFGDEGKAPENPFAKNKRQA